MRAFDERGRAAGEKSAEAAAREDFAVRIAVTRDTEQYAGAAAGSEDTFDAQTYESITRRRHEELE